MELNIKKILMLFTLNCQKKYNLPLIPFLLEGVALDPNLNQQDGIHPNKAGTIVISNTIQDIISKNY